MLKRKTSLHDRCRKNDFYAISTIEEQLFVFTGFNFQIKVMKMFCKLPFLTIIFIGIVIFDNKIPLSFAKDLSTEPTEVDQVEMASTLKIVNQANEAGLVEGQINKKRRKIAEGQINKKRRKSAGRTVHFNPNKRKTSGRSFGAPGSMFDNSEIKSGIHF